MRHPALAIFSIGLILLAACGRESHKTITEADALNTLSNVPMSSTRDAFGKKGNKSSNVSVEGLRQLLVQLVASGQIQLPNRSRGAITNGQFDMTSLNNLFSLLQPSNGGSPSIWSLASGIMNFANGNSAQAGFNLTSILDLLNAAMPIIMTIAPQYGAIIQALTFIIPLVVNIINLFKKPKPTPTPSASLMFGLPTHA